MASISLSGQSKQRQIVILAVGSVILGGLLLFQLPRTLNRGSEVAPAPTTPQPPAAPTAPVAPTSPVAPASPVAPPTPVSPLAPTSTSPAPARLMALTRFKSKDPFVQQVSTVAAATPTGASSGSSAPAPAPSSAPPPPPSPEPTSERATFRAVQPSGRSAGAETARIAVNGKTESVAVSKTFPKGNPVFKLVSIGDDTVKVGIARGTLKGGSQTVTLSKGEPLTLLNTVDGKRYKLELVSVARS